MPFKIYLSLTKTYEAIEIGPLGHNVFCFMFYDFEIFFRYLKNVNIILSMFCL